MISLNGYARFILHTGIEVGQTIYCIGPYYPFLYRPEELKDHLIGETNPPVDIMGTERWRVNYDNIFAIIDNWNIQYFPTEAIAQQALNEYKDILAIEDEETRYNEYDNWIAERSSWAIGI